jgi:hypothetical protein
MFLLLQNSRSLSLAKGGFKNGNLEEMNKWVFSHCQALVDKAYSQCCLVRGGSKPLVSVLSSYLR